MNWRNKIIEWDVSVTPWPIPDHSVHCCVTSPPYYRLRSYKISPSVWGGEAGCAHEWGQSLPGDSRGGSGTPTDKNGRGEEYARAVERGRVCGKCGAWEGCLGLEPSLDLYIENIVRVFREVRRVLRPDGVTWLNLGDGFSTDPGNGRGQETVWGGKPNRSAMDKGGCGVKNKDLIGMPWRVALALQVDGWWLRSDVIFSKMNPLPEALSGWRWERHRVKTGRAPVDWSLAPKSWNYGEGAHNGIPEGNYRKVGDPGATVAVWADCPGCEKCESNEGYVLRCGSWRPTRAHEYVFMLTASENYFCDSYAVREPASAASLKRINQKSFDLQMGGEKDYRNGVNTSRSARKTLENFVANPGRNPRDVWHLALEGSDENHYATYPTKLIEPCIKSSISSYGCCAVCGMPWVPVIERAILPPVDRVNNNQFKHDDTTTHGEGGSTLRNRIEKNCIGWRASCRCGTPDKSRCVVLDPFMGSGTTAIVARRLGADFVGLEKKGEYIEIARRRLAEREGAMFREEEDGSTKEHEWDTKEEERQPQITQISADEEGGE